MYEELIKKLEICLLNRMKNNEDSPDSLFFSLNKIQNDLDYEDDVKELILKVNNYYIKNKKNKEMCIRDRLTITLKTKEKIIATYYFDTKEHLNNTKNTLSLGDTVKLEGELNRCV